MADLLGFSHANISQVNKDWSKIEKIFSDRWTSGQQQKVKKNNHSCYNQCMWNTICDHTPETLKQMGSISRRPHRASLLYAKTKKLKLDNIRLENPMSLKFTWTFQVIDIRRKNTDGISHQNVVVLWWWDKYFWFTSSPSVVIDHFLRSTCNQITDADNVHPTFGMWYRRRFAADKSAKSLWRYSANTD